MYILQNRRKEKAEKKRELMTICAVIHLGEYNI